MNRNYRSIRSLLVSAAGGIAFIAFMAGPSAFAEPPASSGAMRTANLTLADLDLTQASDFDIARDRIRHMAQRLCESMRDPLSLSHHEAFLECVEHATAAAQPKLEQLAAAQMPAAKLAAAQR